MRVVCSGDRNRQSGCNRRWLPAKGAVVCELRQSCKHDADSRRDRIIEFIEQYFSTHYRPPTVREIGDGAGISSTSMVVYHMRVLVADGLVLDTGEHGENRRYVPAWLPGAIAREMQRRRGQL